MHCSVGHFKDIKLFLKHFVLKVVSKGLQMDIFDRKYKGALLSCKIVNLYKEPFITMQFQRTSAN